MTITYQTVWDKSVVLLKGETKYFTSSELNSLIQNDAFNRVAEEVGFPKANYSSYLTSGEWQVSAPSNFIKIDPNSQVTYKGDGSISKLNPRELISIGRDNVLDASPGTPRDYFLESDTMIGIYPPSTSGCVVIPYVKRPAWTTTTSGTVWGSSTNELTERCYMAAVYWTVAECMSKDEDARTAEYLSKYTAEISRLKSQYNMMLEIRRDMKPHQNYAK